MLSTPSRGHRTGRPLICDVQNRFLFRSLPLISIKIYATPGGAGVASTLHFSMRDRMERNNAKERHCKGDSVMSRRHGYKSHMHYWRSSLFVRHRYSDPTPWKRYLAAEKGIRINKKYKTTRFRRAAFRSQDLNFNTNPPNNNNNDKKKKKKRCNQSHANFSAGWVANKFPWGWNGNL